MTPDTQLPELKALVVDDDVSICDLIKVFTEQEGFETATISDPEYFATLYSDDFNLIILDLNMPHVDGIELIRFLGNKNCTATLILVSAAEREILSAAQGLATSQNLKLLDAISKPIDHEKLKSLIQKSKTHITSGSRESLYSDSIPRQNTVELPSLSEFQDAIDHENFEVYFQPKIKLDDQSIAGVEALARWIHPEKGSIPPDYFILFAERYGLIQDLTEVLLRKTCRYMKEWPEISKSFRVSFNISELSIIDLHFPEVISRILDENQIDSSRFILEITETTISSNQMTELDVLTRLRLRGFQLSIDDFGTGHSSLARLHQFPFSELKIDGSFVGTADTDFESRMIVKNTIELARSLDLSVVAEGAERQAQIDILGEFGCDIVQGYFFSKPLPNKNFIEWLSQRQSITSSQPL